MAAPPQGDVAFSSCGYCRKFLLNPKGAAFLGPRLLLVLRLMFLVLVLRKCSVMVLRGC